ncbi:MAG: hypothetical protein EOO52_05870 [Gammaproteobacteria bacterium]|nr:MAG: hypothetical protein EOO52_05870 [Gammaproteobacteria bacterium]
MSDDLINEEDEAEEPIEDDVEDADADDEPLDSDDAGYTASTKAAAVVEALEDFSIASRQKIRDELEDQVAAFLARGGVISEVPPNVTADPPKKPSPDYGGRPI